MAAALADRAAGWWPSCPTLAHVVVVDDATADRRWAEAGRATAAPRPCTPGPTCWPPIRSRRASTSARRPGHLHLHRRHHRPVQGLHAQPQLPRRPGQPDRHLLGAHAPTTWCGRRCRCSTSTPSSTAVVGTAGVRRPGRHLPPLLGLELLAGDEPGRRHHHLHARHHGLPAGPRRRPARDAAIRRARGQHQPAPARRRAACRSRSTTSSGAASGSTTFSGAYGVTEASLVSWQPPGVRQPPQRRGRDQRRVLRRPHLRRRRPRARRAAPRARSCCGPSARTSCSRATGARPEATVETSRNWWYHTGDIGPGRRRRLPLLRGPQGRLPAPPGREHLQLRGRAHPDGPRQAGRRGRARRAQRADRGRPQGHRHRWPRATTRAHRASCSAGASTSCPTSPCPATSSSAPSCPAARSVGCSSASCATRASPPAPGTPRRPASPTRSAEGLGPP